MIEQISQFGNVFKIPELRRKILITIGILALCRLGVYIPIPGIDTSALHRLFEQSSQEGGLGRILGLVNMFAGGALSRAAVFGLGIMPYISASIIFQLLSSVIPTLEQLQKEGEAGRKKINQYTRYGTIVLSLVQGFFIASWLEGSGADYRTMGEVVINPGWSFKLMTILTLTTGTAFIMWLGEQITERGIGNGISLIIFAGIVAGMPDGIVRVFQKVKLGDFGAFDVAVIVVFMVLVVAFIVFFERGQRRIPVQYAKRVVGRKMYGGQSTHLPLKVNSAGVIPPIFASSILLFPAQIAQYIDHAWMRAVQNALSPGDWRYNVVYVGLIIFFCYFYTAVTFNPVDVADNLKKQGGFIPGIRPGKKTAEFIDKVLTRITFGGAMYVSLVCVLPTFLMAHFKVPFYFGGTGLMIVVGVALDTVQQIEGHLLSRHYDGFTGPKGSRIKGRRSR